MPELLPYERACEVMEDLLGPSMSVGTLQGLVERWAKQLEPVEEQIKVARSQAEVLHQDETGLYVAGQRQWMHESRHRALDQTQLFILNEAKRRSGPSASWQIFTG